MSVGLAPHACACLLSFSVRKTDTCRGSRVRVSVLNTFVSGRRAQRLPLLSSHKPVNFFLHPHGATSVQDNAGNLRDAAKRLRRDDAEMVSDKFLLRFCYTA